jgi:hypothetical protein
MNILSRLKSDSEFRLKAILITMLAILIFGMNGETKKESQSFDTCNQYNTFYSVTPLEGWNWENGQNYKDYLPSGDNEALCTANGCAIARMPTFGIDKKICVPYALESWYVTNADLCKQGLCSAPYDSSFSLCKTCDSGETPQVCTSNEKAIASILQSMAPNLSCKTAYYMTIFGGGFLALLLLVAI